MNTATMEGGVRNPQIGANNLDHGKGRPGSLRGKQFGQRDGPPGANILDASLEPTTIPITTAMEVPEIWSIGHGRPLTSPKTRFSEQPGFEFLPLLRTGAFASRALAAVLHVQLVGCSKHADSQLLTHLKTMVK